MQIQLAADHKRLLLNRTEQAVGLTLYVLFAWRIWPERLDLQHAYAILLTISEGIVAVLLLIRTRSGLISARGSDWILAFAGTCGSLLVIRGGHPISIPVGTLLLLFGLVVHVIAKLSLLRSFGLVAADRGVKVRGLYRLLRHPMYAGYMITHVGFLLIAPTTWNIVVYSLEWTVLVMRMFAEERILMQNPTYSDYSARVRYRIIPGVF